MDRLGFIVSANVLQHCSFLPQAPTGSQAIHVRHPGSPHLLLGSPVSWKGSGSNVGTDLGHICWCASMCWGLSLGLCIHQAVGLPVAARAGRAILLTCVGTEGRVYAQVCGTHSPWAPLCVS